jgi:hypothetical protein
MKKFEYMEMEYDIRDGIQAVDLLNELGKKGWEFVFPFIAASTIIFLFKREVVQIPSFNELVKSIAKPFRMPNVK